jgi:hypothetical protein
MVPYSVATDEMNEGKEYSAVVTRCLLRNAVVREVPGVVQRQLMEKAKTAWKVQSQNAFPKVSFRDISSMCSC